MNLDLTRSLLTHMRHDPGGMASVFNGRRRTWRELGDRAARLACALQSLGMQPGDRVGMLALNTDAYLDFILGTWWGGGALNPINIRWTQTEVAYSLDDCDTAIVLLDDHFVQWEPELRARSKSLRIVIHVGDGAAPDGTLGLESLLESHLPVAPSARAGADLAGVFYTGGTTGFPKGVMLSHSALVLNAVSGLIHLNYLDDEVILAVAPLFHQAGMCIVLRAVLRGCRTVLVESFDPVQVLALTQAERASFTLLVPTMLQRVLDCPSFAKFDVSSMRQILYGASPIGEGLLKQAMAQLPKAALMQGYGMTETGGPYTLLPWACHTGANGEAPRLRSAGRPTWGFQMRIVGPAGENLPAGEIGEVATSGEGMMTGYWGRPAETAATLRDGWLYSGDAGYVDEAGYLFLVDRIKDMIVTGGENVYSAEVENALSTHPGIASCAVIGIPSEKWGEAVHAVIVPRADAVLTVATVRAHCKALIAGYKCPVSIELREALPISGAGKLLKHVLRQPYWADRERRIG